MNKKMMMVFYFLLMLRVGRCTDDQIFETKTVGVGEDVTLTCARQTSGALDTLFWIRLVSGSFPEFLGATFNFDDGGVNKTPRITAKQGPGTFLLQIHETKPSDAGVYYCIKVNGFIMTFLKGTFLRIKGPEPDITAVTQDFPSDPVRPGDSVSLQCSVLSDSENKTCPGGHSVFWFRAGSDESHLSLIYAHGNSDDECEKSPEAGSPQKCVYSFSKNVSSSDAGTYYCAVASCGEILFGNGAKLDIEASNMTFADCQRINTALCLLCAALAISLIIIALLTYIIKKEMCNHGDAAAVLQTNAASTTGDQQSQLTDEDSLVYSVPNFTRGRLGRSVWRGSSSVEGESIYTDVRVLGYSMNSNLYTEGPK